MSDSVLRVGGWAGGSVLEQTIGSIIGVTYFGMTGTAFHIATPIDRLFCLSILMMLFRHLDGIVVLDLLQNVEFVIFPMSVFVERNASCHTVDLDLSKRTFNSGGVRRLLHQYSS